MNKHWFFIFLLFGTTFSYSQKKCNYQLVGFKTIHTGGAPMSNENGKPIRNQTIEYNIYITNSTSLKPNIQTVWLNQQQYNFSIERVKELPITKNNNGKQEILVKKNSKFVWELVIKEENFFKKLSMPSIAVKNELVVVLINNKLSKKSLTELASPMYE